MSILGELRSELAFFVFADAKFNEKITAEQAADLIKKVQEALTILSENEEEKSEKELILRKPNIDG